LKNKIIVLVFIFIFDVNGAIINKNINIKSDSVEFIEQLNQISFQNNVEIDSDNIIIKADSAIYDNSEDLISFIGMPTTIKSEEVEVEFSGTAQKILFYNDEKIHLIGNAYMQYEGISISSELIIFNPKTGKLSSE
jgi:lipopolysaccharide transport protein LptA|tara:strand:- start:104 stop:511 length:408 start_codon:yes stop_codon:yes gene_type:complete